MVEVSFDVSHDSLHWSLALRPAARRFGWLMTSNNSSDRRRTLAAEHLVQMITVIRHIWVSSLSRSG